MLLGGGVGGGGVEGEDVLLHPTRTVAVRAMAQSALYLLIR